MKSIDTFGTLNHLKIANNKYFFYDLNILAKKLQLDLNSLPFSLKILLENLIRNEDGKYITSAKILNFCKVFNENSENNEIYFYPARVLMQDFTGVPAIADLAAMRSVLDKMKIDPNKINPLSRVDLVIDHSLMVDDYKNKNSLSINVEKEFFRNKERYEFLKWGQASFNNFYLVPPGAGICHQVNLENIAKTVWLDKNKNLAFPDSVVGTDSHTTMINSLSVLGWGVGGIEAEAAMLGQPISLNIPKVTGFEISGKLKEGITATDLVLTITEKLRIHGVVGNFVEFFGDGMKNLSLADRATVSNMAPEYGATCGYFPTDEETIDYLRMTGRSEEHICLVEEYTKIQGLWCFGNEKIKYNEVIKFNLNEVEPTIAGPKRPQDKILLNDVANSFQTKKMDRKNKNDLINGDIVMAAITSCTNTSNPGVMIAAGLVCKKAVELGLTIKPWVKTSLAPGSKVVTDYLNKAGLLDSLNKLGFNLVGYGCTTCIGNSGPLDNWVSNEINKKNLSVCSVLSGNRNFEGRIHQDIKSNYLASPPLVVIYAIAGNIKINLKKDPIAVNKEGKKIFFSDLWPNSREVNDYLQKSISKNMFSKRYKKIYKGDENWSKIKTTKNKTFNWNVSSTYIKEPPYFKDHDSENIKDIIGARVLVMLGDSVTTDHISPAGAIKIDSPAGKYLLERQINEKNFNSYGSRRGNHEVMIRGTFANIRIKNELVKGTEGGFTNYFLDNKIQSIYQASQKYLEKNIPLIVIAGKEYGTGSSRDWAAKGTRLLGVKAVIAESFERIHRSNLIGMGVLPLQFIKGQNKESLKISGKEKYNFRNLDKISPGKKIICEIKDDSKFQNIELVCRVDTSKELEYFKAGGILQYVLNSIVQNER